MFIECLLFTYASQGSAPQIPGYTFGTDKVPPAPITMQEFAKLKQTVLFTDEDVRYLKMSYDVVKDQIDDILDVWYGFVGSHDFLIYYFSDKETGQPNGEYLAAVRKRFGQWILDTARADYDEKWLAYQFEIAHRHHRSGKNKTDGVKSVDNISQRYLVTFIVPITTTLKPFLAKGGHSAEEVEKMYLAWLKSVTLQVALWSYPYVKDGDW
ncbi:MAG: protogloblin ApPgb [Armatimonadota bacterium]